MKLYYSNSSPYSRKVRLVLHEKGLFGQVEQLLINPFEERDELNAINPLGKIPVLISDAGKAIYDSPVICQYLDGLVMANSLTPKSHYWDVLQWQALADGIMDASYQIVVEQRRPEQEQSEKWINHWSDDIKRSLLVMQNELNLIGSKTTLAHLSFATAISYLELRLPHHLLEAELKALMNWYQQFSLKTSMKETQLF